MIYTSPPMHARVSPVTVFMSVCALMLAPTAPASANDDVGVAITVHNDVSGKIQSQTVKIDNGSNVFGREIVRTGPDSSAKIVLKDSTNLNVGPSSVVTLDNFVFKGDSDYKQAGLNLVKGAFRFTSGGSDKRAYDLKTPVGTIGVRGTEFHVLVKDKVAHIEVNDGLTKICPASLSDNAAVVKFEQQNQSCQKACMDVGPGQAVDVTSACIKVAQFTNMSVGQNAVSFAQATSVMTGVGSLAETVAVVSVVGAAAAAGGLATTLNSSSSSQNQDLVTPVSP